MGQLQSPNKVKDKGSNKGKVIVKGQKVTDKDMKRKVKVKDETNVKVTDTVEKSKVRGLTEGQETVKVTSEVAMDTGDTQMWYDVVNVVLLRSALATKDEQVRLDAFALLCENPKTSETIERVDIELIQSFIPDNLNNQNPAFRQHMISLLKKVSRAWFHKIEDTNLFCLLDENSIQKHDTFVGEANTSGNAN